MDMSNTRRAWRILAFGMLLLVLTVPASAVVVSFPDPNLEAAIRSAISKPTGDILDTDLSILIYLAPYGHTGKKIVDLSGIEYCTNLKDLDLGYNEIVDISPLAGLTSLTHLGLEKNQIAETDALANLTNLVSLMLFSNHIAHIQALAEIPRLAQLWLNDNEIEDIAAIADLSAVTQLYLHDNRIANVSPLAGLTSLETLYLNNNQVADLSPLAPLDHLTYLHLEGNQISEVTGLLANSGLGTGDWIYLNANPLSAQACIDIDILRDRGVAVANDPCGGGEGLVVTFPDVVLERVIRGAINKPTGDILDSDLLGLASLGEGGSTYYDMANLSGIEYCRNLVWLALEENQVFDVTPLAGLTRLTALDLGPLSIYIDKKHTAPASANKQILDLTPLAGLTHLEYLMLGNKNIVDVSSLAGLNGLKALVLSTNQITDIGPLAGLSNLAWLFLDDNQINDVSPLANLSGLTYLCLDDNQIVDLSALLRNTGLGAHDYITLNENPLSAQACTDISILEDRGVSVINDPCVGVGFVFYVTPRSGRYQQGDSLSLTVAFVGEVGTAQIQWTKNGVDIPGQVSDTFTIDTLSVDDTGAYRVRVTDDSKAVYTTPPAIITVTETALPVSTRSTLFSSSMGIVLASVLVLRCARRHGAPANPA